MNPALLRRLPKVSLHDHLDGGLRSSTVLELAGLRGVPLPVSETAALEHWITTECAGSLERYLAVSDVMVSLLAGDLSAITRVASEFVEDLAADGVVYAEVRWAPEELAVDGLSLADVVGAVSAGLANGVARARHSGASIDVRQILCAIRTERRSLEVAELAIELRDSGVVGFDLAGAELGAPAREHASAFALLRQAGMPVTIHAGEADGVASIRDALEHGSAVRIGHGARLAEDLGDGAGQSDRLGEVAELVRSGGVALELCPTSNLQTDASRWPALQRHPFDRLRRAGFIVTVNPDNRLLSGTDLTNELGLLADAFDYDLDDIERFQLDAAAASFLPPPEKADLVRGIASAFSAIGG